MTDTPEGISTRQAFATRAVLGGPGESGARHALEARVADLENGEAGFAFSSGFAAMATVLELLDTGAHVIATEDLQAGTYRLFEGIRKRTAGLSFDFVDMSDPSAIEAAIQPERTKLIWVETPANPLLTLTDLSAVSGIAKRHGLITLCDNSLCSPALQRPIDHGTNIVLHRTAPYLDGLSGAVGDDCGVVVMAGVDFVLDRLAYLRNALGVTAGEAECAAVLNALKSLPVRMERHCDNAEAVVAFLAAHPTVERVVHPGHESHPQHDLARRQMRRGGGQVSALVSGGFEKARRVVDRCALFALSESFGGAESRIEHPASMSHEAIPPEIRAALGIPDGLIRLSLGLEDPADLIADMQQALS